MALASFQSLAFALSFYAALICSVLYYCSVFASPGFTFRHRLPAPRSCVPQLFKLKAMEGNDEKYNNDEQFIVNEGGGNFFEGFVKPTLTANEDEPPMSLEELEMLATPFDEHLPKINTVTLVGRVGNDPEPRYFDDGKVVLNLSLAVKRKYHPLERKVRAIRSGEEETDWFPLEFWGRDAEYVTNFVERGARIGITGSLVVDGWVDKRTGEQRRRPKILVRHIDIVESRAEAELRKSNKGSNENRDWEKKRINYGDYDDDGGPSPAGTGGFFS